MRISAAEGVYTGCVRGEAEPPMAQQVFFFLWTPLEACARPEGQPASSSAFLCGATQRTKQLEAGGLGCGAARH